jgi:hypothetical protein
MSRTPVGLAQDAVFALLVAQAAQGGSVLPTPSFDESILRFAESVPLEASSRVETWLNFVPGDPRPVANEVNGDGTETRVFVLPCAVDWVVLGRGAAPGQSASPRRDRFEAGQMELAACFAGPRLLSLGAGVSAWLTFADQTAQLAGDRSLMAALPNASAITINLEILMTARTSIG